MVARVRRGRRARRRARGAHRRRADAAPRPRSRSSRARRRVALLPSRDGGHDARPRRARRARARGAAQRAALDPGRRGRGLRRDRGRRVLRRASSRSRAAVRELGLPLTLNVVLHRHNLARVAEITALAQRLGAARLELANAQYQGWALRNRAALLPTRAQLDAAAQEVARLRRETAGLEILFVLPDYHRDRPKPCMGGWGRQSLVVAPDGRVLPCHGAAELPGLEFWRVPERPLAECWSDAPGMNAFRGEAWMPRAVPRLPRAHARLRRLPLSGVRAHGRCVGHRPRVLARARARRDPARARGAQSNLPRRSRIAGLRRAGETRQIGQRQSGRLGVAPLCAMRRRSVVRGTPSERAAAATLPFASRRARAMSGARRRAPRARGRRTAPARGRAPRIPRSRRSARPESARRAARARSRARARCRAMRVARAPRAPASREPRRRRAVAARRSARAPRRTAAGCLRAARAAAESRSGSRRAGRTGRRGSGPRARRPRGRAGSPRRSARANRRGSLLPSRSNSRSCSTRRSRPWSAASSSPISSRNSVPPAARSRRPIRRATAPVNAPRSCPNSSLSSTDGASDAQSACTNGSWRRGERRCSVRATSPLPTPVSPSRSTVDDSAATRSTSRSTRRIGALAATSSGQITVPPPIPSPREESTARCADSSTRGRRVRSMPGSSERTMFGGVES